MSLRKIFFATSLCLLISCTGKSDDSKYTEQATEAVATGVEFIEIPVELKGEEEIQRAVEDGHQPWRLSPADVACASLAARQIKVKLSDCRLDEEDKDKAVASAQTQGTMYRVYLEQLVKPGGIWTARRIEVTRPNK